MSTCICTLQLFHLENRRRGSSKKPQQQRHQDEDGERQPEPSRAEPRSDFCSSVGFSSGLPPPLSFLMLQNISQAAETVPLCRPRLIYKHQRGIQLHSSPPPPPPSVRPPPAGQPYAGTERGQDGGEWTPERGLQLLLRPGLAHPLQTEQKADVWKRNFSQVGDAMCVLQNKPLT